MQEIFVTGIGSRRTPPDMLQTMIALGRRLAELGFTLRSGAADGADSAFEQGWDQHPGCKKEIWLPWRGFNDHSTDGVCAIPSRLLDRFEAIASTVHPAWARLKADPAKQAVIKLHTRNVAQVLGQDAATPSHFLVCWTPDGCTGEASRTRDTGGTATAIVLAERHGVPVFNLKDAGALQAVLALAERLARQRERRFHPEGVLPQGDAIWVFGSNLAGRHGAGAAKVARELFGAVFGQGEGPQGRSYAIPTKDGRSGTAPLSDPMATLSLGKVKEGVDRFLGYAEQHAEETFFLPKIGCVLASHSDEDMALLFERAPANCVFSEDWRPWLGLPSTGVASGDKPLAPAVNIWSGAEGLAGALTNMSERAREKGKIRHSYPVSVNGVDYPDSEAAYQALKCPGQETYNDGLMIDLIALKFKQNPKLYQLTLERGGEAWLATCTHFTGAKSERAQSWEGHGVQSRFIRNLVLGFTKARNGRGHVTRVVHVKDAPWDVYVGRANGDLPGHKLSNPWKVGEDGTLAEVVQRYHEHLLASPALMQQALALKGKTLACWCRKRPNITGLCHGEVIAAVADGQPWSLPAPAQGDLFG